MNTDKKIGKKAKDPKRSADNGPQAMKYGRYEIKEELGRGSMGVVYLAHDPQIDRLIALKVLRQDRVTSEAFVQRFLKEARTIGRLSHSNIVTVYDIGRDQETIYIAMEFLEGDPLNKIMEERKIGNEEIIGLGLQITEALHYAHEKGVVHRDIKPSNIIVNPSGRIKITDFGIAHIEDPAASVQTQAGEILGTPAYMSPEQVLSRPVDGRSDLFSLGVILYEMAAGKRPFQGDNMPAVFRAVTQEDPEPPDRLKPAVSPSLSGVIMKCLEKDPMKRFETGDALGYALGSLPTGGVMEGEQPSPAQRKKRISLPLILLAVFLAVLGAGVLYYFLNPKTVPPPAAEKGKKEKTMLAFLKVESTPEGAQIFVDGNFRGQAPARLELPAGKHEIRLVLANHYDWEAQVQLREESETPLSVRLATMEGKK
jgi:serine/threonine protein kinase